MHLRLNFALYLFSSLLLLWFWRLLRHFATLQSTSNFSYERPDETQIRGN